ncbi:NADH dehydrogenase [ubiquinone] 1 alpha subcomplex subunit 13-like [Orbicella faveolata]|uniref:NADH dehydrogenase [ubiquinone] 1 alpha subcomplex subunit 13-like n=1 Tax=Orbicella faveolata TaxID=48498 RepID=UPI0009E496A4|nr:NADH dehydrogenase [ubiquinone] 1 alpha subcomplex subunit 13-like [Orbicella faveolata]
MASSLVKQPVKQEMPPKGGYPPIEFARNIPKRGPSGVALFIGGATVMAFGFYKVIMGNRQRCELLKEQRYARIGVLPLLQAEHDRSCLRLLKENEELEAQIMKDVPDWKVGESVYHTDKWVTPMPVQVEKL